MSIEPADLSALEATIEQNLEAFWLVGEALLEIRDRKLYKASHGSFAGYCQDRWGFSEATSFRRLAQARAARGLPEGAPAPSQRSTRKAVARDSKRPPTEAEPPPGVVDPLPFITSTSATVLAHRYDLTQLSAAKANIEEAIAILKPKVVRDPECQHRRKRQTSGLVICDDCGARKVGPTWKVA